MNRSLPLALLMAGTFLGCPEGDVTPGPVDTVADGVDADAQQDGGGDDIAVADVDVETGVDITVVDAQDAGDATDDTPASADAEVGGTDADVTPETDANPVAVCIAQPSPDGLTIISNQAPLVDNASLSCPDGVFGGAPVDVNVFSLVSDCSEGPVTALIEWDASVAGATVVAGALHGCDFGACTQGQVGADGELVLTFTPQDHASAHVVVMADVDFQIAIHTACECAATCTGCSPVCAGECGSCPSGQLCSVTGACECAPSCEGKACGPDGCGGSCGDCDGLCVEGACRQEGEVCGLPIPLVAPGTASGDTTGAGAELGYAPGGCKLGPSTPIPSGTTDPSPDVVYELTASVQAFYQVRLDADFDAVIYTIDDCDAVAATCKAESLAVGSPGLLSLPMAAGQTVRIVVDGFSSDGQVAAGTYTLTAAVEGDTCEVATPVDLPAATSGDTSAASADLTVPAACGAGLPAGDGPDVVYAINVEAAGTYMLAASAYFDAVWFLMSDCGAGTADCAASLSTPTNTYATQEMSLEAGLYYLVVAGATATDAGAFSFQMGPVAVVDPGEEVSLGDTCTAPLTVSQLPFQDTGDFADFTDTNGLVCGAPENRPDVVYTYTPTNNAIVRASAVGGQVTAMKWCPGVECLEGDTGGTWSVVAGSPIHFVVESTTEAGGLYEFELVEAGICEEPIPVGETTVRGATFGANDNNTAAPAGCNGETSGPDLVYRFVAPTDGDYSVQLAAVSPPGSAVVAFVHQDDCAGACLASVTSDSPAVVSMTEGAAIVLVVDGVAPGVVFDLSIGRPGEDCGNPFVVETLPFTQTLALAEKADDGAIQPGCVGWHPTALEPYQHPGFTAPNDTGSDAVWRFVAPETGRYNFRVDGAGVGWTVSETCTHLANPKACTVESEPWTVTRAMEAGETAFVVVDAMDANPADVTVSITGDAGEHCDNPIVARVSPNHSGAESFEALLPHSNAADGVPGSCGPLAAGAPDAVWELWPASPGIVSVNATAANMFEVVTGQCETGDCAYQYAYADGQGAPQNATVQVAAGEPLFIKWAATGGTSSLIIDYTCAQTCDDVQCGNNPCTDEPCGKACPGDFQCAGNWCEGAACSTTDDCAAPGRCIANVCLVPKEAGQACGSDAECLSEKCSSAASLGGIGDEAICVQCQTHEDCLFDGGLCLVGVCVPPRPNGDACSEGIQCESGHCQTGTGSVEPSGVCVACLANEHCANPMVCVQSSCGDLGAVDAPCDEGPDCMSGICVAEQCTSCEGHDDCPVDTYCSATKECAPQGDLGDACADHAMCKGYCDDASGQCADPKSIPESCGHDAECLSGHCVNDVCSECSADDDCSEGGWCDSGTCAPQVGSGEGCQTHSECVTGVCDEVLKVCFDCSLSTDCPDPTTQFCNALSVCAARGDAGALCLESVECLDGLSCSGGFCVECSQHDQCPDGEFCNALSQCAPKLDIGAGCLEDVVCASGHCPVGFCTECSPGDADVECGELKYCDALGYCQKLKPDGHAPCFEDFECTNGNCANGVCSECDESADCAAGQWCQVIVGGQCLDKGPLGTICLEDFECDSELCDEGLCSSCSYGQQSGCGAGEYCDGKGPLEPSECASEKALGTGCAEHLECATDLCDITCVDCINEIVVGEPANPVGCNSGQFCYAGACYDKAVTGASCPASDGVIVPPNHTCISGVCELGTCVECSNLPQTGCDFANQYCEFGACNDKQANGSSCSFADQCTGGACIDSTCQTSCTSTAECAADEWCSLLLGGCQPKKDLGIGCTDPEQCTSGECATVCVECTDHLDCPGGWCNANSCAPPKANGSGCGVDAECTSGICDAFTCVECTAVPQEGCDFANEFCEGAQCNAKLSIGSSCTFDDQCVSNKCAGFVCETPCTNSSQCAGDEWCSLVLGACQPKKANGVGCTDPEQCTSGECATVCVECTDHLDCSSSTQFCENTVGASFTCQSKRANGSGCNTDDWCISDVCDAFTCTACLVDADCNDATNDKCKVNVGLNECVDCLAHGDCPGGWCNANSCAAPKSNGSGCGVDAECASGICDAFTCVECTAVPQEGCNFSNEYCEGAQCKAKLSNGSSCTFDDQCVSNKCAGFVCETPCTNSNQCAGDEWCSLVLGACQPKKANGIGCTDPEQCTSNVCDSVCVACTQNSHCSGGTPYCRVVALAPNYCVGCLQNSHCNNNQYCNDSSEVCSSDKGSGSSCTFSGQCAGPGPYSLGETCCVINAGGNTCQTLDFGEFCSAYE